MNWPGGVRYSCSLQSLVIFFFLPHLSTLLFSRTGGVLFHLDSSTHKFPGFPLKNLYSLVIACCALSRPCCNEHSYLLSSCLSRIENFAPSVISHHTRHCPATDCLGRLLFGEHLSLYDVWSKPWRVARFQGLHGLALISQKGQGNNSNIKGGQIPPDTCVETK